jgi:hypothetical protein
VIGANMGCKLFVALQLEVPYHFIERFTRGRSRRIKPPGAFRTSKTEKTPFFDPYKLAGHPSIKVGLRQSGLLPRAYLTVNMSTLLLNEGTPRANVERPAAIPFNSSVVNKLREDGAAWTSRDLRDSGARIPPEWWFSASGTSRRRLSEEVTLWGKWKGEEADSA